MTETRMTVPNVLFEDEINAQIFLVVVLIDFTRLVRAAPISVRTSRVTKGMKVNH
jgi:hypothetical protein